MSGSTSKKVVISRFEREPVVGFVNPDTYLLPEGVEVLTPSGIVSIIAYEEIKTVCFVKDFDSPGNSWERRLYTTRPKMEGLWVRMLFRDGEAMDGILANNLLQLSAFGFTFTPPDPTSRNQRIFVPKSALREFVVAGVVGSPLRRKKPKPAAEGQIKLFE